MKSIKLYERSVNVRDNEQSIPILVTSKDIIKWSLEGHKENFKGLERMMNASKVIEKVNKADGVLELEDAEFLILKESIDQADFSMIPVIIHVPEILQAMIDAEKVEEI